MIPKGHTSVHIALCCTSANVHHNCLDWPTGRALLDATYDPLERVFITEPKEMWDTVVQQELRDAQ